MSEFKPPSRYEAQPVSRRFTARCVACKHKWEVAVDTPEWCTPPQECPECGATGNES